MSAGKRLAKRSIVGLKVSGLDKDTGLYQSGIIIGSKNPDELNFHNCHTGITSNSKYVVRFEKNGETREFSESELIGPGFGSINSLKLRSGQRTFVTHNGREVCGSVVYHRPNIDEILISIIPQTANEIPFDVTKKLDEVRLLESRKSARLQEQDFDFARLADVSDRKRNVTTASIDVPKQNNIMSRKRRPSSSNIFQALVSSPLPMTDGGDEINMDECSAAMVLMSLSCSPHSPQWGDSNTNGIISSSWSSSSSGASSWLSNVNGANVAGNNVGVVVAEKSTISVVGLPASVQVDKPEAGTGTVTTEHLNNSSPTPSSRNSSDDGIESDNYEGLWDEPRKKKTRLIFKCTWPGCSMMKESCFEIEAHVRYAHLGPKHDSSGDHEEEFYYTEVEVTDLSSSFSGSVSSGISVAFSPTLSHMDMARPPDQDPEYKLNQMHQRKSPNGNTHLKNPKQRLSPKSSPVRRPRGDTKKCRKVYGMERRDLWCTQCRWKKACQRFGD